MEKIKQKKLAALMVDKAVVLRCKDYAHPDILKDIMSWSDEEAREVWEKIVEFIDSYANTYPFNHEIVIDLDGRVCPFCKKYDKSGEIIGWIAGVLFCNDGDVFCPFGIRFGFCDRQEKTLWKEISDTENSGIMTVKWYQETVDSINNIFMEVESLG